MTAGIRPTVAFAVALWFIGKSDAAQYLGKFLGKLSELHHGVSGEVYAVDGRTLYIKDFTYDGQGPAAYFYASVHKGADKNGFRLRDENGKGDVIRRYRKEGVTLTLPEGKSLNNIKIFYVWCEEFDVNFGDVKIPRNYEYPRPQKIDALKGVHAISSDNIVIVDAQTLLIPNLSYDGEAPDAKFWVGRGSKPSPQGIRVPDENGKEVPLRRYDRKTVVLTLPGDLTVFDIGHFGIWCEQFTVDFGHVLIPEGLNIPPSLKMLGVSPQKLQQQVDITSKVSNSRPVVGGHLPPTTFRPPHLFSIFNRRSDDGLASSQQPNSVQYNPFHQGYHQQSKLNCEVLYDDLAFEVRWAVAGESIVLQLVAKLDDREYMSFGPSGDDSKSLMIGGDVVVAWIDKQTLKGFAVDYHLKDKSQCSGPTGSCPDDRLTPNTNSIRLLNAATVNGYSIVTYQRPLRASDQYDRQIFTNHSQAIIWAIGPLNQRDEVSFHSSYLKKNFLIDFGRPAKWNCPMPESEQSIVAPVQTRFRTKAVNAVDDESEEEDPIIPVTKRTNGRRRGGNRGSSTTENFNDSENSATKTKEQAQPRRKGPQRGSNSAVRAVPAPTPVKKRDAWDIPPIQCYEPEDGVFYAQMGPTGGKRGYPAITGHVGWGISWYINGLLIPEINVVRGKTYTFVVEGGLDPEVSAKYHPFYITDDPIGGYEYKTDEEKENIRIFAGVRKEKDGSLIPTGTGRLCHWTQTGELEADDFESFGAYQRTLELKCDQGEPGVIQWTPDSHTPNTVYYQCFTHRHLGWKINVHDSCDEQPAASNMESAILPAPHDFLDKLYSDLDESPSIRIETRVKPNNIFKEGKEDKEYKSIVSEKKIISSTLVPLPIAGPSNEQVAIEPFLIQPEPNFISPFFQRLEPQFALFTYKPYHLEHEHENQQYFKPSTTLNTIYKSSTSSHLDIPTNTTTTNKPLTIQNVYFKDKIAVATNLFNQTYLVPPPVELPLKFNENIMVRRPSNHSPNNLKRPVQFSIKMSLPNLSPPRQFGHPKMPVNKNVYRLHPSSHRPYYFEFDSKPKFLTNTPLGQAQQYVLSPTAPVITKSPPIKIQMMNGATEISKSEEIKNVEISPQQASTEREPEIQTAPSTSSTDFTPTFRRPAYNSAFKPGSVKIESGFKPIITKEFLDRVDQNVPEIKVESEMGMIDIDKANRYEFKPVHAFEPIFVPSPTFKPVKEKRVKINKRPVIKKRQQYMKIIVKHPRSLTEDEPMAEAAERVETYYLPPSDQKPIDHIREPSEIDIEAPDSSVDLDSPPDVVVAYDGKRVSGQSLTAKLSDQTHILDQRLSKASAFIRARPQFVQFKGELPPLNPEFINKNAPQLQKSVGLLNRDLDAPSLPDVQSITRLSRISNFQSDGRREKREAHHTPEHTAQQEEEQRRNVTQKNTSDYRTYSLKTYISSIFIAYFLKYLYFVSI